MSSSYTCPITLEPFDSPRFLINDGFTYEESAIRKWFSNDMGRDHTPMGFTVSGDVKLCDNSCLRKDNPLICPITKEEMKDPMIVLQTGTTYEHDALLKAIKQTICKGKSFYLDGRPLYEIQVYPNKILWKDEYSDYRKPFIMPDVKKYSGLVANLIPMHGKKLIGSTFECFKEEGRYKNEFYKQCYFDSGCFKSMYFNNCRFDSCVFRKNCFCCQFKNCLFIDCDFIIPNMMFTKPMLHGCSFRRCTLIDTSKIGWCSKDNFFKRLELKLVKESDIVLYEKQ